MDMVDSWRAVAANHNGLASIICRSNPILGLSVACERCSLWCILKYMYIINLQALSLENLSVLFHIQISVRT